MFHKDQKYAADDGDGEESKEATMVEDGETEPLLVDTLIETLLLVKVNVNQVLQVTRLVIRPNFL